MLDLEELLLDKNKLKTIPDLVGKFSKLKHLDASFNLLESVSEELGNCVNLVDLTLSSNDLKVCQCFLLGMSGPNSSQTFTAHCLTQI